MPWSTHEVFNQADDLVGYDLLATDAALGEALARAGADWAAQPLGAYARRLGEAATYALAEQANRHVPQLHVFDARGRRIDAVEYHPAWHELLALYRAQGLVSLPLRDTRTGRWTAWAAGFYLHGQVEQGTLCPATMTTAAIPLLAREPALWAAVQPGVWSDEHDPRDRPAAQKAGLWFGMGMTEKQGGSDLRTNATVATAVGAGGRGGEYLLRGHKWFFSVPAADAHLVVARVGQGRGEGGPCACFYVPRWRPDGTKNAVLVQRLKDKVGNRSNASGEVEFHDAWGVLLGEEDRGIPTIIEMATTTRLACVLGSAAILRQATVQAIAYARRRHAFGRALADQPLMRTVLADLALESEAALVLAMRLARAFERDADGTGGPVERAWKRLVTPAAKFWVCKRTVELTGEAMEVFGGNGYVEPGVAARLFREAPVNSIWEGSGNVMCLDVLRGMAREPEAAEALFTDLADAASGAPVILAALKHLRLLLLHGPEELESLGRVLVQQLVLIAQAGLLRRHAPRAVADAFAAARFGTDDHHAPSRVAGAIDPRMLDVAAILARAFPADAA
ncbi:acyl-CoA dehydrogenase family protein [Xylophilus sp.]|uniref:acyl-CoA dehydrogenase family protein n=1 Tax=Xylophilus sp. TaxID=2653893 RepID=UPI0013BD718D|nr:acyl-CoA dehydrogenase family protein [Xylophilus sp.]KAF1045931.1 MAG: putative acyl-CoA dehydrogenase AidB [Xylophilus sp.]